MEREEREVRLQSERYGEQKEKARDVNREGGQPQGMKGERENDKIGNERERVCDTK